MSIKAHDNNQFKQFAETEPISLWLFNIAMESGPFIDGLPGFTYENSMVMFHGELWMS